MLESIILGIIQGVAEWLPVSSEGLIVLVKTNFFNQGEGVKDLISLALFLHFGTFLAALVYFRKDVLNLLKVLFAYKNSTGEASSNSINKKEEDKKVLFFLIITTLISGALGIVFLNYLDELNFDEIENASKIITAGIGALLLITAFLQFKSKKGGQRKSAGLKNSDSIILGIVQAFAALPGLSRSGLTVSALLLRRFNDETALKLSFLMSMPLILGGNIILNLDKFALSVEALAGLVLAFVFGIITIDLFLKLARIINFAWFVLIFGILMISAALI